MRMVLIGLALFTVACECDAPKATPNMFPNTYIITFKDGTQQEVKATNCEPDVNAGSWFKEATSIECYDRMSDAPFPPIRPVASFPYANIRSLQRK